MKESVLDATRMFNMIKTILCIVLLLSTIGVTQKANIQVFNPNSKNWRKKIICII